MSMSALGSRSSARMMATPLSSGGKPFCRMSLRPLPIRAESCHGSTTAERGFMKIIRHDSNQDVVDQQ